ncbi:MAG: 30S ribosomal protein S12 methylthiotransferase RimO [Lachnospiraceae bacterium]|jgi:ribosomal protein S12 methylthiotransferase|nr:ribosomal protein S12 methylthiotransferase RimO [Lachnospiraceae bacterium 10-1]MCX4352844.1 30S ribosomal protein S12 methylthiotransferase RimO [Lachnospiraceae bacterium]
MNILFVSLGCDKNLVDSEVMLGLLAEKGYFFTDDEAEADVVVVNTCCFINDAKEESINTILDMAELKKSGQIKALLVTGCLAQRYKEEIQTEIPEVDAILGTTAILSIAQALEEVLSGKSKNHMETLDKAPAGGMRRVVTTGGYYAYLKIAEGCNKHCTYCIIPKVRGNYRSIPMEDLLKEAEELAEKGVKELILVAQETTLYGSDLYGKKTLPLLLKKLCKIEGIEWIRVLYCYPEEITEELIQVIKEEDKICNYLDIPVQSGSDAVLKRMGRRTNAAQIKQIIGTLREQIPDICIRTTLIAGFPGETDEDHENTLNFVNEMEFDRLGVFTYSEEEDTPAAEMPDQVEETIKEKRRNEIMELQQEIAFDAAGEMTGRKVKAMIEGRMEEENVYVARTYKDAPGIDGYLFINSKGQFLSGDFVEAVITASNEYDLIGEIDAGSAELEDK